MNQAEKEEIKTIKEDVMKVYNAWCLYRSVSKSMLLSIAERLGELTE